MAASGNTIAATNTQIRINFQFFPGTVHAVFNRTGGYASITIDAFLFINPYDWGK
jgi:hypothetical protein